MIERLAFLWPEIVLFATTCVVMVLGLSKDLVWRRATGLVAGLGLAASGVVASVYTPHGQYPPGAGQLLLPNLALYGKVIVAAVGLLLLLLVSGTADRRPRFCSAATSSSAITKRTRGGCSNSSAIPERSTTWRRSCRKRPRSWTRD